MKKLLVLIVVLCLGAQTAFASTFGNGVIGGAAGTDSANQIECGTFTAPEDGTITSISQDQGTAGAHWKGILVDLTSNTIVTNGVGNSTATAVGWATSTMAGNPSMIAGRSYGLCWVYDAIVAWDSSQVGINKDFFDVSNNFTTPTDPTDGVYSNQILPTIYATYTPTGSLEQEGYRFRNDDGSESSATWLAAQDTDVTQPTLASTRLRMLLTTNGDPAAGNYQLEYKLSTDNWWTVATATAQEFFAPSEVFESNFISGTGVLSVPFYSGYQDSDIAVMCVESANQAITTPAGWTQVASSPQSYGTAAAQNAVRLAAFYKVVNGVQANVTVADSGDHTTAIMFGLRNVSTTTPVDITAGSAEAASSTALSWPSVTTTVPNDLVIQCAGLDDDVTSATRISAETNANLTGIKEISNNTTASGAGGGIGAIAGVAPNAASIGNTTANGTINNRHAYLTMAFKPIVQKILIKPSGNIGSGGTDATTAQLAPPSGKTTADFQAGQISDDTNPLPSLNLGSNKYTEFEWNLIATTTAATNDVYQFRVTKNGAPVLTTSVTPQWTIGTPSTASTVARPRLALTPGKIVLLLGKLIIK